MEWLKKITLTLPTKFEFITPILTRIWCFKAKLKRGATLPEVPLGIVIPISVLIASGTYSLIVLVLLENKSQPAAHFKHLTRARAEAENILHYNSLIFFRFSQQEVKLE